MGANPDARQAERNEPAPAPGRRARVTARTIAGAGHAVTAVEGGDGGYMRSPCRQCPWRRDLPTGVFPAEAFRISADTAYDMSTHAFACHMSGTERPKACAGFLLRGAKHNLGVRLALAFGRIDPRLVGDGGLPLYDGYRAMAEANGVAPDDPALRPCRD
jgi:hypothetical protein